MLLGALAAGISRNALIRWGVIKTGEEIIRAG